MASIEEDRAAVMSWFSSPEYRAKVEEERRRTRELKEKIATYRETATACVNCDYPLYEVILVPMECGYGDLGQRPSIPLVPVCEECAPLWYKTIHRAMESGKCATCRRPVVAPRHPFRRRFICSERCRRKYRSRQRSLTRRQASAPSREKTCEVCGSEFIAKRADAKTCSPACRQKAYRQRV